MGRGDAAAAGTWIFHAFDRPKSLITAQVDFVRKFGSAVRARQRDDDGSAGDLKRPFPAEA